MEQTYSLIKSRTFWTLVFMSLLPVANAIIPTLSPMGQTVAEMVLAVAAAYFHQDGVKKFGAKVAASSAS